MSQLSRYRKSVTALLVGAATWLYSSWVPDGHIDRTEWYGLIIVVLGAAGVYGIPNDAPKGQAPDPTESVRDLRPAAGDGDATSTDGPVSAANVPPADWTDEPALPEPEG